MGLAQKRVRNASAAMHGTSEAAAGSADICGTLLALDSFFGSMLLDVAGHVQVLQLKEKLAQMCSNVDSAIEELQARCSEYPR